MSQPNLNEDLNIVANSNLEITLLDGDLNIIQALDDEPNDVGGLTSAELKAKFDEGPNKIKEYINGTLIPEILTEEATEAARAAAEAQRETNENQRIENENARIAAEQARDTAESARADAEQERAAAESARNTAEQARESAEQARADETAGIVAQATEQAVIASNAASEASSSASGASTSASAAAASASSASESASASASSAAAAQASADEALSSKNSAKSEADRAKSEADRAAEIVGGDFVKSSEKGAANGVATLGADGKVPESQLPEISKADIPITSTPDDDTTIWIDPDEDDQTESFYTKAETNTLLQNKADLGTVYSKPETLSDTTKTLFGLDATAVPDDALALLSRFQNGLGNEYVWAKNDAVKAAVDSDSASYRMSSSYSSKTYGKSVKINGDTIELDDTFTPTSAPTSSTTTYWSSLIPFYFYDGYSIRRVISISASGSSYIDFTSSIQVIGIQAGDFVGYVNSQDPAAYPPAVSDGYTYTALGQLGSAARFEVITYTGANQTTKTINFSFTPKVVFIVTNRNNNNYYVPSVYVWGYPRIFKAKTGASGTSYNGLSETFYMVQVTTSSNTMTLAYTTDPSYYLFNDSFETYTVVAIS